MKLAGESDSHDDIMKEVLIKIFKELPGTSKAVTAIIDSTSKPSVAQLEAIRSKKIQLSGFEVCRKVAVNFVKNIVQLTPFETVSDEVWNHLLLTNRLLQANKIFGNTKHLVQRRCEANPMEFEAGKQILGSLDLHLAAKQRDYTARLMRE